MCITDTFEILNHTITTTNSLCHELLEKQERVAFLK